MKRGFRCFIQIDRIPSYANSVWVQEVDDEGNLMDKQYEISRESFNRTNEQGQLVHAINFNHDPIRR
jgi:hypothetical protein|nr:MAG: hypothetical protein [uncultured cyanophage]